MKTIHATINVKKENKEKKQLVTS